ncbi:hypothetical protein SOCE26_097440 [Sorangium cellulosum]|uniref:DoxX family protein n=2 Tax=Sorangium cellulosum TaxID=56 RepID=A0A2L0F9K0_SORCE|nr:hypothetical protein SOCE26_097440 [Sorangium cellulosum]
MDGDQRLGYPAAMSAAPRRNLLRWIAETRAPAPTVLIRLAVGSVFLSEGIQKFLFAAELGAGRFAKIGLPAPEVLGPFVGAVEILCGTFVLLGLATRLAAVPLLAVMLVALATTKIPILMKRGLWAMAHESRTDWAMLLGALFLLLVGAGPLALDARLAPKPSDRAG